MVQYQKDTDPKLLRKPRDRSLRQPLAVALVCFVFVALFLFMGQMNMRALDKALAGYMEKSSLVVVDTIQQATEEMFRSLGTARQAGINPMSGAFRDEDALTLEEGFINGLVDLVQELDLIENSGRLDQKAFESFLKDEGLTQISILDEQGHIVCQNRPIPEEVLKHVTPVTQGTKMFTTNIFSHTRNTVPFHFMILRRGSGKGTIVLVLDEDGFYFRKMKYCLQYVLRDMVRLPDRTYTYLVATDLKGRLLGEIGTTNPTSDTADLETRKIQTQRKDLREVSAPLTILNRPAGIIRMGLHADDIFQILSKNRRNIYISMGCMVIITLLSMWLLYKNQTRYLKNMQEMHERVHQAERRASLGRLAAGLAHEIRNPLNAISMGVQRIHKESPHKLTKVIRDEISRLNRIIDDFIGIAKSRKLEISACDIRTLLEQIVLLVKDEGESKNIEIQTQWPDRELIVSINRDKMKQALLNIINNAMESIIDRGRVVISLEQRDKDWGLMKITDTGAGLTPEQIKHIFDLDYTTKEKGLGVGLPLAYEIIKGHGGEMRVNSKPGQGTVFEILMPLYRG